MIRMAVASPRRGKTSAICSSKSRTPSQFISTKAPLPVESAFTSSAILFWFRRENARALSQTSARYNRKPMEMKHVIRVVLASPSDTQAERDEVSVVIGNLNQMHRDAGSPVLIELWRWETNAYPGLHLKGPQGLIDDSLRIEDADVLIGVFCQRFGTPVADAASGTAHEIQRAITAWNAKGAPQVMIYFNREVGPLSADKDQFSKTPRL